MSLLDRALQRPLNYGSLSAREQWKIDENLGILDWAPTDEEAEEYCKRRGIERE